MLSVAPFAVPGVERFSPGHQPTTIAQHSAHEVGQSSVHQAQRLHASHQHGGHHGSHDAFGAPAPSAPETRLPGGHGRPQPLHSIVLPPPPPPAVAPPVGAATVQSGFSSAESPTSLAEGESGNSAAPVQTFGSTLANATSVPITAAPLASINSEPMLTLEQTSHIGGPVSTDASASADVSIENNTRVESGFGVVPSGVPDTAGAEQGGMIDIGFGTRGPVGGNPSAIDSHLRPSLPKALSPETDGVEWRRSIFSTEGFWSRLDPPSTRPLPQHHHSDSSGDDEGDQSLPLDRRLDAEDDPNSKTEEEDLPDNFEETDELAEILRDVLLGESGQESSEGGMIELASFSAAPLPQKSQRPIRLSRSDADSVAGSNASPTSAAEIEMDRSRGRSQVFELASAPADAADNLPVDDPQNGAPTRTPTTSSAANEEQATGKGAA